MRGPTPNGGGELLARRGNGAAALGAESRSEGARSCHGTDARDTQASRLPSDSDQPPAHQDKSDRVMGAGRERSIALSFGSRPLGPQSTPFIGVHSIGVTVATARHQSNTPVEWRALKSDLMKFNARAHVSSALARGQLVDWHRMLNDELEWPSHDGEQASEFRWLVGGQLMNGE